MGEVLIMIVDTIQYNDHILHPLSNELNSNYFYILPPPSFTSGIFFIMVYSNIF